MYFYFKIYSYCVYLEGNIIAILKSQIFNKIIYPKNVFLQFIFEN